MQNLFNTEINDFVYVKFFMTKVLLVKDLKR